MTYEEYFWHISELAKAGHVATEQDLDEEIALINQLPCTGGGLPKPLLAGQQEAAFVDVSALDAGEKFPGHPCPHCTWLAHYEWAKSMHEARRNGMPETPPALASDSGMIGGCGDREQEKGILQSTRTPRIVTMRVRRSSRLAIAARECSHCDVLTIERGPVQRPSPTRRFHQTAPRERNPHI